MVDLMLDVESLGNIPGCVLLQYTLVPFNINGKPYSGSLEPLDIRLNMADQIAEGFEVDSDTLAWWMKQDIDVRRYVFGGLTRRGDFFIQTTNYYQAAVMEHKDYRVWSTSAKVDFGIPPVLFKRAGVPYPVNHRAERCARTFNEMVKLKYPKMKGSKLVTTHNAIDDCKRQIDDLQIAYRTFQDKPEETITAVETALL